MLSHVCVPRSTVINDRCTSDNKSRLAKTTVSFRTAECIDNFDIWLTSATGHVSVCTVHVNVSCSCLQVYVIRNGAGLSAEADEAKSISNTT